MDEVSLRPIQEADLADFGRYGTDPEVGGVFNWAGFRDPQAMRRRWSEDGWLGVDHSVLAIVRSGSLVGDVSFKDRSPGALTGAVYEIGIALFPEHRGHGIGTQAQRLLADHLFATTPAHRLEAYTDVDNHPEQRSLEKVGFTLEAHLRQFLFRAGRWRDSLLYGLLR